MRDIKFYSPNWTNHSNKSHDIDILINEKTTKNKLYNLLNKSEWWVAKKRLKSEINNTDHNLIKTYSQKVYNKVYKNKFQKWEINKEEFERWMRLFQTAFWEMEWIFKNKPRDQKFKTWFDHLLWVLDNILNSQTPTIEECILAILHDSVEEIPGYTLEHIKNVYGNKIAKWINNLTKKYNKECIKENAKKDLLSLLVIWLKKNGTNIKNASNIEIKRIREKEINAKIKKEYDNNRYKY